MLSYYTIQYLHAVVEAADVLPYALAPYTCVALHIHKVPQRQNHLLPRKGTQSSIVIVVVVVIPESRDDSLSCTSIMYHYSCGKQKAEFLREFFGKVQRFI